MRSAFDFTSQILKNIEEIIYKMGLLEGSKLTLRPIKLIKESKIKSIYSSLAIEGNQLTIEQITAILEGKLVLGPQKDILEAKNAIDVYKDLKR